MRNKLQAAKEQEVHYSKTAESYHANNITGDIEHLLASELLLGHLRHLSIKKVLDVGSGTGRVVSLLRQQRPDILCVGLEPVAALRNVGIAAGLPPSSLIAGDALALPYANDEFDVVCAFGMLHHVSDPSKVISEMLRVAKIGIFISDANNFGQGNFFSRLAKQLAHALQIWPALIFAKTKGKGYNFSDSDGVYFSYSVFDNFRQIRKRCNRIHITNTMGNGINPYRTAAHVAIFAVKQATQPFS